MINAHFANGFFGRQVAGAESIDQNLVAARSCRRARKSRKVSLQIFRVIRKRLQIIAADHRGAGVGPRVNGSGRTGVVIHRHPLFHG